MKGLRILQRSTGIVIGMDGGNNKLPKIKESISPALDSLQQYNSKWNHRLGRKEKVHVADWWYETEANSFLSFHSAWQDKLTTIPNHADYTEKMTPVAGTNVQWEMSPTFKYRPGQGKFVDFLVTHDSPIRILPATMGAGKTVSATAALQQLARKALVIIPPSLKDEWMDTFANPNFTRLSPEQYHYVSGDANMEALYQSVKDGEEVPWEITVIGINALQRFITARKAIDDEFSLMEFFDKAGWGVRVVDEAHKCQHFHTLCSSLMNFEANIFLTATLMKEYDFDATMENAAYPKKDRCEVPKPSNHIELISYKYTWDCWIPDCNGPMGYMHSKYENHILKHKGSLKSYLAMINAMLNRDFVTKFKPGDRAVVFFGRVPMVEAFIDLVKASYPKLKVIKYGSGDSKEILKEADIIITTVKKAGTGTDIPQLRYVLQTIPISAKGENYQNVGRLRNLHDKSTTFAYIWTPKVTKHFDYHEKRQNELGPLINTRTKITFPNALKGKQSRPKFK